MANITTGCLARVNALPADQARRIVSGSDQLDPGAMTGCSHETLVTRQ